MDGENITLDQHDTRSEARAHKLGEKIDKLTGADMSDNTAAILAAMGNKGGDGAAGLGMGGGLIGGVVLGALLGNRGGLLGGNGAVDAAGVVTPAMLTSAINGVTDNNNVTTILQSLGDIKGSIPLAEGQVQLALAGAQSDLTNLINQGSVALMQGQFAINKNVSDTTAQIIATEVATQDVVQNGNAAIQASLTGLATQSLQSTYALNTAIRDDGDRTRALIVAQNDQMLNRELATAQAALLEQRAIGRSRDVEVNVTQTVAQNQAQAQTQAQQQQQAILLSQLVGVVNGLQNAVATNSNMIIGNTGATTTGPQTANPVNVRT